MLHTMTPTPTMKVRLMNTCSNLLWRAIDLLAETFPVIAQHYYQKIIGTEYQKEYAQFNITTNDCILHIGCGTFPLTEMILSSTCKPQKIIGIDNRKQATTIAQKFITTYQNKSNIIIKHGDGKTFDLTGFTTIIISSCASPKTEILAHILNQAMPQTKIILREVESSAPTILHYVHAQKELSIQDTLSHHPFPFVQPFGWISYLLIKK